MRYIRSAILTMFVVSACGLLSAACRTPDAAHSEIIEDDSTDIRKTEVSPSEKDAAEPAVAADKAGKLFVVYVEHDGPSADIFLQKYDNALRPVGSRVQINQAKGTAKAWRGDPPTIVVSPGGDIYVGWTRAAAEGDGNDLVLSTSRDEGETFADAVRVNDDLKPASHGMHSLAVGEDGRIYLAWLDERNVIQAERAENTGDTQDEIRRPSDGQLIKIHHNAEFADNTPAKPEAAAEPNSEVFFAVSSDGGRTFSANKKLAGDVCPCCKTSMLAAADGALYVSWRQVLPGDFRHIAVASTKDQGETFSKRTIVSDDKWKIHACPVSGAAMSNGEKNVLNVVWYTQGEAGQAGLYLASSRDGGKTFDPRRIVDPSRTISGTPVAFDDSHGSTMCLFGLNGDWIKTAGVDTVLSSAIVMGDLITDASSPAATRINGNIYTAFVRTAGDKHAVWLAAIR